MKIGDQVVYISPLSRKEGFQMEVIDVEGDYVTTSWINAEGVKREATLPMLSLEVV